MRSSSSALLVLVASVLALPACSPKTQFAHDLPAAYRSVTYKSGLTETLRACSSALEAAGYDVACADSVAGLVFTTPRKIPPKSKEIGGTGRMQWMLLVRQMEAGSLVTAELVFEAPYVDAWWPNRMSQGDAMTAYRALFADIQAQLDAKGESHSQ